MLVQRLRRWPTLNQHCFHVSCAGIRTRADKRGGDYVINGHKLWISNVDKSDWICLLANTEAGYGHSNKSLIIVPTTTPGNEQSRYVHMVLI